MKYLLALILAFSFAAQAETVVLTEQNTLSLNGPVTGQSVTGLMTKLQELNQIDTKEPVFLVLNSPGGSVYAGFDFIRFAQTSKRPVHTVTIFAASMAFQLVESLGNRYVTSYSTLMSHLAKGSLGDAEMPGQLDSRYGHFLSHLREQDAIVVGRTKGKQTIESYTQLIQKEYWANSSKAIKDGFADSEVNLLCSKSLAGSNNQIIDLGFFAINAEFSNCPLITSPISISIARGLNYVENNKIDINTEYLKIFEVRNFKF